MGFKQGAIAKVWEVEPSESGKYVKVRVSISRKNQEGVYEQDFADYLRLIGEANNKARKYLKSGDRIRLDGTDVTTSYNKETKRQFINFLVFNYEDADEYFRQHPHADSATSTSTPSEPAATEGAAEEVEAAATANTDLPF